MELSKQELHLIREWFDALEDTRPDYIDTADYALAKRIYEAAGMRVPGHVERGSVDYSSYSEHL